MIKKTENQAPVDFDIIVRPLITEKAMRGAENNQVTFEVRTDATKPAIKKAVESIFGVKVKAVNTIRQVGKKKRFRGRLGERSETKKAVITLAEGHIDVTAGV